MLNKQIVCLFKMIMCKEEHLLIATKQADSSSHFPSQEDSQMVYDELCLVSEKLQTTIGGSGEGRHLQHRVKNHALLIALLVRNLGHPMVNETSLLSY